MRPVPDHSPATLDLLVPWDIPLECQLNAPNKHQIRQSLQQLLHALQRPDAYHSVVDIEHILSNLDYPAIQPAQVKSTKTALKTDEVNDFDQFFCVNHVQPKDTGIETYNPDVSLCLVRGLLVNCYKFMLLCAQTPQLDSHQVALQKQGFVSYINLLARVFSLDELVNSTYP